MKTILLLVTLAVVAAPAFAQNNIEPPLITVTGQAEVRVPPDEVLFTLAVENVDKDMLVANRKTDDSVKQILAIARKHNVKPEDVQTSQISVQPKYNTDDVEYEARRNIKRVLIGYQVSKTVAVRLRELARFDEMLADILKAGITRLSIWNSATPSFGSIATKRGGWRFAPRKRRPGCWLARLANRLGRRIRLPKPPATITAATTLRKTSQALPGNLPPAIPRSLREVFQLPPK